MEVCIFVHCTMIFTALSCLKSERSPAGASGLGGKSITGCVSDGLKGPSRIFTPDSSSWRVSHKSFPSNLTDTGKITCKPVETPVDCGLGRCEWIIWFSSEEAGNCSLRIL